MSIEFDERIKQTINFAIEKLEQIDQNINGENYKIHCVNIYEKKILMYKVDDPTIIKMISYSKNMEPVGLYETASVTSTTSDVINDQGQGQEQEQGQGQEQEKQMISDTSVLLTEMTNPETSTTSDEQNSNQLDQLAQSGGRRNKSSSIFYSNKYSTTSEQNYTYKKSDGYSETSMIGGGYNGLVSEKSEMMNIDTTKNRRMKKKNSTHSSNTTNLNMDIFKKAMMKGGAVSNQDLNNKMKEYGIGSTSTSSVCE